VARELLAIDQRPEGHRPYDSIATTPVRQ
jgi:hypothetical protein